MAGMVSIKTIEFKLKVGEYMPRGKKTSVEDIYKVMVGYASNKNVNDLARGLNMPESTCRKIILNNKDKSEFKKLCEQKEEEFADRATRIINLGTELLERRLKTAIDKQDELEALIDYVYSCDDSELNHKDKRDIVNQIRKIQLNGLSEVTTAVGTMYDKRALAKGESTQNQTMVVKMDPEVKELSK